ncbi:hypothetical protein BSK48_02780 [Paenibacillus odorifer]|uniref:DUF885 domain-containing protein n=1 Tax=Paenibacillus TaxID=44249 RepID=UPI00096F42E8|nr:DUF885 domain-containing protein [Paenibacillus odorifer]OMD73652.1 hypothetical protein BSK48_02780 [Paenibacillus odorifer]OMD78142.1 hypothetical protein BSK50_10275 [Paenibacillus odorifer]OMD86688.1 hypothetical protein BSK53_04590 [Paenibacillus odorifer]
MNLVRQMFKNTRLTILLAVVLLVLLIAGGLFGQTQHQPESLDGLIQKMAVDTLKNDPETQLYFDVKNVEGIRWDPTKLTDLSDADYELLNDKRNDLLKKLNNYDAAMLSPEDKLTYDILKWDLSAAQQVYKYWDLNTNDYLSLTNFPPYFANNYPIRSQADAKNYIVALNGFSDKVAHVINRIQDRREKGIVPASEFLKEMLTSYSKLQNTKPEETILYSLYAEKLTELKLDPSEEETLKKTLAQTLTDHVLASYGKLADVIKNDLMKQASVNQGIWNQPGGSEYYSARLKLTTGTDLSPQKIHEIAKRKVEEIEKELRSGASGHAQTTSAARFLTGDKLLQALNSSLSDATPYLSDWFEEELIPDHPVDVRAYSALFASAGGMYIPLSINGDRSGRFVIPLENPTSEEIVKLLALHEGIPGHHFQFSIQYDQPSIPLIRKITMTAGYVEGWAVYMESLCAEKGLLDRNMVLNRLLGNSMGTVIDTGIHGLKWTREQANEYLVRVTGTGNDALIDSVIAYPGLNENYAIGSEQFQSLREKAESELGDRFDIKAFHSVLLRNGNMPFPILEQQVNQYIKSAK